MKNLKELRIGIVGLGYVGLPLAVEFGKKRSTVGFDLDQTRIEELESGFDVTLEISKYELDQSTKLVLTSDESLLQDCNCFIITVPTPIDKDKHPDLSHIESASRLVAKYLSNGSIVIYESTVFPGCTEEICVPILQKISGLPYLSDDKNEKGFYCGYSPERINPGDNDHKLTTIKKVTSGSTPKIASLIDSLYAEIITAGTYPASSIKVAEAAKVIENSQRDLNIAFMNELSIIFNLLEIDTKEVLDAASTKWNFLPFTPGLVGGHCIGVDPYYLTHKAEIAGYSPNVLLSGRSINDEMGRYVAEKIESAMQKAKLDKTDSRVLICGLTFKENCPDIRNTKVIDIFNELISKGFDTHLYDPWVDEDKFENYYNAKCMKNLNENIKYDVLILATPHDIFLSEWQNIKSNLNEKSLIFDLKSSLAKNESDFRL